MSALRPWQVVLLGAAAGLLSRAVVAQPSDAQPSDAQPSDAQPSDAQPSGALPAASSLQPGERESPSVAGPPVGGEATQHSGAATPNAPPPTAEPTVRVGVVTQARVSAPFTPAEDNAPSASLVIVRPNFSGRLLDGKVLWGVNTEMVGGPRLLDAEIRYQPLREFGVRIGQYRTPTSRQFRAPLFALQFPMRSVVSDVFRAGRDIGVEFDGSVFGDALGYEVGLFNGNGPNQAGRLPDEYLAAARLELRVLKTVPVPSETPELDGGPDGILVGLLGNQRHLAARPDPASELDPPAPLPERTTTTVGLDVTAHFGRFFATAEGYLQEQPLSGAEDAVWRGGFAQMGYYALPQRLEVAARGNVVDRDRQGTQTRLEGSLNLYPDRNHFKLNALYSWIHSSQAGLGYPEGTSHLALLQVQVQLQ